MSATRPPASKPGCSIDGCEKLARRGHPLCGMHYSRLRRHGDPRYVREVRLCSVDGCEQRHHQHGYCVMHYGRWKNHGDPNQTALSARHAQSKDCDSRHQARGFCRSHYRPMAAKSNAPVHDRGVLEPADRTRSVRHALSPATSWQDSRRLPNRPNIDGSLRRLKLVIAGAGFGLPAARTDATESFPVNPNAYRVRRGAGTPTREMMAHRSLLRTLVGPIPEDHDIDHLCGNSLCVDPQHLEPVTPWENRRRAAEASRLLAELRRAKAAG